MSQSGMTSVAVALMGPPDSIQDVMALVGSFPGLEPVPCPYENEEDVLDVYQHVPKHCRSILFTGPLPYYRVTESVTPHLPVTYVPFDDEALYRALFHAQAKHQITSISVDTIPRNRVVEVYRDLGLPSEQIYSLEYSTAIRRRDFVSFHRRHLKEGRATVALTCLRSAHLELQALGLPCERIVPPPSVLLKSLEKAYLLAQNLRVSENQTAVGILDVSMAFSLARRERTEYDVQKLRLRVQAELMEYVAEVGGYLTSTGFDEFLFFTTQGPVLRSSRNLTVAPFLDRIQSLRSGGVWLGIGMGNTAAKAGEYARLAMSHAHHTGEGTCFVVLDDRRVVGPLGGERLPLPTRNYSTKTQQLAEQARLSPVTLTKVTQTAQALGRMGFTAQDLARQLLITPRSARRLCRILEAVSLIEEVGTEAPAAQGRPRTVFQLSAPLRQLEREG